MLRFAGEGSCTLRGMTSRCGMWVRHSQNLSCNLRLQQFHDGHSCRSSNPARPLECNHARTEPAARVQRASPAASPIEARVTAAQLSLLALTAALLLSMTTRINVGWLA